MSKSKIIVLIVFVGAVLLGLIFGAIFLRRVDPGEVGVLIDYGKGSTTGEPFLKNVPTAKFFTVNPVTQRLAKYPVRQQTLELKATVDNNLVTGGDAAKCSDRGGIPLWINTTVLWRVDPTKAAELYLLRPGYTLDVDDDDNEADDNDIEQSVVLAKAMGAISQSCSEFGYTDIFGGSRDDFGLRVYTLLEEDLLSAYIILDDFIVGEINSTPEIEESLSTKSSSEQSAQAAEFKADEARTTAQGAADAVKIKAQGDADAVVIAAQANAEAITIEALAQAEAIQLISDELAKHGITLVEWQWLQTWDGKTPQTLVITDEMGSPLMTIDLQPTSTP